MSHYLNRGPRKCQLAERSVLRRCLREAIDEECVVIADVAFWCEVDESTVRRWLDGDARIDIESLMRSPRLYSRFLAALVRAHVQSQDEKIRIAQG
jgi:hypothetical protein